MRWTFPLGLPSLWRLLSHRQHVNIPKKTSQGQHLAARPGAAPQEPPGSSTCSRQEQQQWAGSPSPGGTGRNQQRKCKALLLLAGCSKIDVQGFIGLNENPELQLHVKSENKELFINSRRRGALDWTKRSQVIFLFFSKVPTVFVYRGKTKGNKVKNKSSIF